MRFAKQNENVCSGRSPHKLVCGSATALNDVWEINMATQTLYFIGHVRITIGLGGQPIRCIVTQETIEIILPL